MLGAGPPLHAPYPCSTTGPKTIINTQMWIVPPGLQGQKYLPLSECYGRSRSSQYSSSLFATSWHCLEFGEPRMAKPQILNA